MRAQRDRPERDRIDLIDVDPEIFVEGGAAQPTSPSRQVLRVVGVTAVLVVAAFVWWPGGQDPEWKVFASAPVPVTGLGDELVFGEPPGRLLSADLAPPPVDVKPELGYIFGEPGGTLLSSRWASFRSRPSGAANAPISTAVPNVGGVTAVVKRVRVRHSVEWGPLAGRTWLVNTNRFDDAEAVEFANKVAIIEGKPALAHHYDLGAMKPVGSIAAFDCVVLLTDLFEGTRGRGAALPTMVTWETPDGEVSLGSIAAPADALPLVEFVLGDGQETTVHDLPAVAIDSRVLGNVVAWVEDGRLIMVAGPLVIDRLTALAETVRRATEGEWRRIGLADVRNTDVVTVNFGDSITLYIDTEASTGDVLAFTIQVVDGQLQKCIVERSDIGTMLCATGSVEMPLLATFEHNGNAFVLAVVDRSVANGAELRIEIPEGTLTLPLEEFGDKAPGLTVATLLPDEYGTIELWNDSEVVASL